MRHTFEDLTEKDVKQYAYIWSYERLRKAYNNLHDMRLNLAGEIHQLTHKYCIYGRNPLIQEKTRKMRNEKAILLQKINIFFAIIEEEMKIRTTPNPQNIANGIYGYYS